MVVSRFDSYSGHVCQIGSVREWGIMSVTDYMEIYRTEPEYMYATDDIRIDISACGGGTLDRSYVNNKWIYQVWESGTLIDSGEFSLPLKESHYSAMASLIYHLLQYAAGYGESVEKFVSRNIRALKKALEKVIVSEHLAETDNHICDFPCMTLDE